jgi:hypothetical protein
LRVSFSSPYAAGVFFGRPQRARLGADSSEREAAELLVADLEAQLERRIVRRDEDAAARVDQLRRLAAAQAGPHHQRPRLGRELQEPRAVAVLAGVAPQIVGRSEPGLCVRREHQPRDLLLEAIRRDLGVRPLGVEQHRDRDVVVGIARDHGLVALAAAGVADLPVRPGEAEPRAEAVVGKDPLRQPGRGAHRPQHRGADDAALLERALEADQVQHRRAQPARGVEARRRPVIGRAQQLRDRQVVAGAPGDGAAVLAVAGAGELERQRDLVPHVLGVVPARHALDHEAEQREVVVAVVPVLALLAQRAPARQHALRGRLGRGAASRQAGGVVEQVPDRQRPDAGPGLREEAVQGVVEAQLALVRQPQDQRRREPLADRRDRIRGLGRGGRLRLEVREAVAAGQDRQPALEHRDRHSRDRPARERVGRQRVDGAREGEVVADECARDRRGRGRGLGRGRLARARGGEHPQSHDGGAATRSHELMIPDFAAAAYTPG